MINQDGAAQEQVLHHRERLLYLTASWPFRLGGEVFFVPELKEMVERDIDIMIVPRDVPHSRTMCELPVSLAPRIYAEPILSPRVLGAFLLEALRSPRRLCRSLGMLFSSIDLHLARNLAVAPKAIWLARLARTTGATHIHAQWGGTTATIAMIASSMTNIPWSVTYHRHDIERANLLALKLRCASFVRFISEAGLILAKEIAGVSQIGHAYVLHLGIEIPSSQCIHWASSRSVPVLCCAASLIPLKGHSVLLNALARVKSNNVQFRFLVAGDGELRNELESRCRELGLSEWVQFLGHVSRAQLLAAYSHSEIDVFVLASFIEGIPVSAMEASACCIPCILSDVGGVRELLDNGSGFLTPAGDAAALASAIESLLNDPDLRRRMGTEARKRVESSFDARRTAAIFLELVFKHSRSSTNPMCDRCVVPAATGALSKDAF
jgi:colanic acid/amylovoran biosynthesis glycosyltransferase